MAKDKNAEVVDEYLARGESAKTADRPKFQEMLVRIKQDRDIEYVIVDKVDRFSRELRGAVNLIQELQDAGAHLISVKEHIDETPGGQLNLHILLSMADFYSTNLATEAIKGMTQKAKVGGTPGQAKIGYLNVRKVIDNRVVKDGCRT